VGNSGAIAAKGQAVRDELQERLDEAIAAGDLAACLEIIEALEQRDREAVKREFTKAALRLGIYAQSFVSQRYVS
jgi:hypothetical protein